MPLYRSAFVLGEEPELGLDDLNATSMAEVAESVGSAIWKALPAQPPAGSAVWLSINTFLGYFRGRIAGVARGQVVVRLGSGEGRSNPRSLARLVAEELGE